MITRTTTAVIMASSTHAPRTPTWTRRTEWMARWICRFRRLTYRYWRLAVEPTQRSPAVEFRWLIRIRFSDRHRSVRSVARRWISSNTRRSFRHRAVTPRMKSTRSWSPMPTRSAQTTRCSRSVKSAESYRSTRRASCAPGCSSIWWWGT